MTIYGVQIEQLIAREAAGGDKEEMKKRLVVSHTFTFPIPNLSTNVVVVQWLCDRSLHTLYKSDLHFDQ